MQRQFKIRVFVLAGAVWGVVLLGCDDKEKTQAGRLETQSTSNLNAPSSAASVSGRNRQTSAGSGMDFGEDWERESATRSRNKDAVTAASRGDTWAIVLNTFSGSDHRQAAATMISEIRRVAPQYSDVRVSSTDKGSMVLYGAYPGPQDAAARSDLQRIKAFTVRDMQLFRRAMLAKVVDDVASGASLHPYDLHTVRQRHPGVKTLYTLDIALWGDDETGSMTLADIHRKAEASVRELRAQGVEAYFYHDNDRMLSSVTVGVFGQSAVDAQSGVVSPEIRALVKRFPKRLVNGEPLLIKKNKFDRRPNADTYPQEPFLVLVPE